MKFSTFLLVVIVGFLTSSMYAQKTIWLDKNLKKTDLKNAIYYKIGNKIEGEVSFFYKSRTIFRRVDFSDGKENGKFSEFYKTGELKETGKYKNGLREGNWKTYYKTGKIKKKGKYSNGNKVGIWKVFYKND